MKLRRRSVILLSGGLDSSANLALCAEQDEPVLAITCRYGQRAAVPEARAAAAFCAYYGIEHRVIELPWLGALGGSALTDGAREVPRLETSVLDDPSVTRESAKSVWVPNRNGVLIQVAAAFAERSGAEQVVVGFNREEGATFPDNTPDFLRASSLALGYSTANGVRAFSYTAELDKREIVRSLSKLERRFPFDLVWSCYHGGEAPCGTCESCRRFARARAEA